MNNQQAPKRAVILTDRGESVSYDDGWKITWHWVRNPMGKEYQSIKCALPPTFTPNQKTESRMRF